MRPRPIDIAPFRHLYPFASRYAEVNGLRMHSVDEGRGEPVVMVHGNPTWSFYWRNLVRGLSPQYRVIAVDHIGCGLSDKPRSYNYRLAQHIDNLARLVEQLDLKGVTLLAASSKEKDFAGKPGIKKTEQAKMVGKMLAERCIEKGISSVVFDRSGYKYHGRVKSLADAAREGGLKF